MRFALTYCKDNVAGKNIADRFRELGFMPHVPIIELKNETLYSDLNEKEYPELRNIEFLVFLSTHRSAAGESALTIHTPGNFRGNDLGGAVGKVCMTSAFVCKWLFLELTKQVAAHATIKEKYKVTLEATHHGPLTDIPCCFVELGSKESDWVDREAALILATVVSGLDQYAVDERWTAVIAVGGPHYAPNFNAIQAESPYAIGHIIALYNLPLTDSMISEAEAKTKEQVKLVLVDFKGCGNAGQRDEVISVIERNGLSYKKTKEAKN